MLRSSAGNFYNYFRPGAGEESSLGRLSRGASSRPPTPLLPVSSSTAPLPPVFFFFSPLPAPSSRLSNHARPLLVVRFFPSLFFHPTSTPLPSPVRSYPFLCLSRYCSERGVVLARALARAARAEYQNIWVVYLLRSSPSSDTVIIIVRHLLEVVPSRLRISASPRDAPSNEAWDRASHSATRQAI